MNLSLRKLLLASGTCIALLGATMQNAAAWTFTASGTINFGNDGSGAFGTIGDLFGKSFTQTISIDPEASAHHQGDPYFRATSGLNAGEVHLTITVENVTRHYNFSPNDPGSDSFAIVQIDPYGDAVEQRFGSQTTATDEVYFFAQAYGHAMGNSLSFNQNWTSASKPVVSSASHFNDYGLDVWFNSNDAIITISAVPEPETYAMLLVGLGVMGAVTRRRKVKQA